jgi:hypothetical protein
MGILNLTKSLVIYFLFYLFYFILYAGSFCEDLISLLILKYSTLLVKLIQFLI